MDKNLTLRALEGFEQIKGKREIWHDVWQEIEDMVCPQTKKEKDSGNTLDSTAIWAREQLAAGMQSLLINPALPWFSLRLVAKDNDETAREFVNSYEAQTWLEQTQRILLEVLSYPENNFYNQVHEFFLNLVAYGTGIFYVQEQEQSKRLLFKNIPLRECYFSEDGQGKITTLFRQFELTVAQAASRWSQDTEFKQAAEKNPQDTITILHAVLPEGLSSSKKKTDNNTTYISLYIDEGKQRLLQEGSYQRFPFQVARWMIRDNDPYGVPPACHVLPDIRLINELRRLHVSYIKKCITPPLLVPEHGYYTPMSMKAGAVNPYRNGTVDPIKPLSVLENMIPSDVEAAKCRDAILKAFSVDVFRMPEMTKEMTATEVQALTEDRMRLMSAIVGRIESEFLSPVIQTVYGLLTQYNQIPPLEFGASLHSPKIAIEYISPLSKAQKAASYQGVEAVLGFLQRSGLANIDPTIYANLDTDKMLRLFFDLKSVPVSILRTPEEAAKTKKQMQQLLAAQSMTAQLSAGQLNQSSNGALQA